MFRPATPADLAAMMAMYAHSRQIMRRHGNTEQWVAYPTEAIVLDDIRRRAAYIVGQGEGCFALVEGVEPTYAVISPGRWIDPTAPYATLHRLATAPHGRGVGLRALQFAAGRFPYLRADTHPTNHIMRRLLEEFGFVESGTVRMADGTPRLAFEWWRMDEVPPSLRDYVEGQVIPLYRAFDPAHDPRHARRVVARAMAIARQQGADPELFALVYAAAAMHDLGLAHGREQHHLHSGRIIRQCDALGRWFSPAQVELIAQAAEDHRASASAPPRSLLGRIVAEADRDIEPLTIVRRTVQYSLAHHPELSPLGHRDRCLAHLREKYSPSGYIRLWLSPSPNAAPLAELHALLADTPRLTAMIDHLLASL